MTSWVEVTLDTTPPALVHEAPARVSPPDTWLTLVRANEDLGPVSASFTDALGSVHQVGVERLGERLLAVSLATVGLASGPGSLEIRVRDRACNLTVRTVEVTLDRPRAYDLHLTLSGFVSGEVSMASAFEAEVAFERPFDLTLTKDRSYETETSVAPTLDMTLEITDGPGQ